MSTLFNSSTRRALVIGLAAAALPRSVLGQQQAGLALGIPGGAQVSVRHNFLIKVQNYAAASLNALLASDADYLKTNPRRF
jgi:hypothetical protein